MICSRYLAVFGNINLVSIWKPCVPGCQTFLQVNMTNLSASNLTNISQMQAMTNITKDGEALDVPLKISYITTVIFNSITCPFTVVLNVLVIMAVKRRPRLQSYANILLACLAVTDTFTGLLVQPTFIIWRIFQLLSGINTDTISLPHDFLIVAVTLSSALHLMLVTGERLIAIKYTFVYPYLVTTLNIKVTVTAFWVLALCCTILKRTFVNHRDWENMGEKIGNALVFIVLISSIVFIVMSYVILYNETVHLQNKIKAQQLSEEEIARFVKERKAPYTTVYIVGAVLLCLSPGAALTILSFIRELNLSYSVPWVGTIVMFNSPQSTDLLLATICISNIFSSCSSCKLKD